jgi:hypothetical protein
MRKQAPGPTVKSPAPAPEAIGLRFEVDTSAKPGEALRPLVELLRQVARRERERERTAVGVEKVVPDQT